MYLALGIIVIVGIVGYVLVDFFEYRLMIKQNEELKKNMDKHTTQTGALQNDRIYERTTIPKR
ncbi:MAG: hypothetical protein CMC55_02200 [Flavobacteriaceae bacterium]|nr:hypothetical protein [Flavobacteriaceae bacterium]